MNTEKIIKPAMPMSEKLELVLKKLEEQKALDPVVITMPEHSFTETLVVASATSGRHARGIADSIAQLCHEKGMEFFGIEGQEASEWILIDCNDLVINIFLEDTRANYRLEDLWGARSRLREERS